MNPTTTRSGGYTLIATIVIALGMVIFTSSFPPAMADIQHDENGKDLVHIHSDALQEHTDQQFSQAHQIKLLIGVVIVLFGGNMWWTRKYINNQDEVNKSRSKEIKGINQKLDTLQGEHDMNQQIRGCAADPTVLETSIRDAVTNALQPLIDSFKHR